MKALLLAAGLGTRLRPITDTLPKCLVPINGRPLLDYWISHLGKHNFVNEIIINTHHLPDQVRKYIITSPWSSRIRLVHEEILLGTGATLAQQRDSLSNEDFLLAHADNLTIFDLRKFIECHKSRPAGCVATMMTFNSDDPQSCGIIEKDEKGIVYNMHEKVAVPPSILANAAVYLFNPDIWKLMDKFSLLDIFDISKDIIPQLYGRIFTYHNNIYHRDIGNLLSLRLAEDEFPEIYSIFEEANGFL